MARDTYFVVVSVIHRFGTLGRHNMDGHLSNWSLDHGWLVKAVEHFDEGGELRSGHLANHRLACLSASKIGMTTTVWVIGSG